MILLIDNYDSFTFNVYQYLCQLGQKVKVVRNDKMAMSDIERMAPDAIVISPGPGNPDQAGITLETIETFAGSIPILGICLGHQSIAQAFGGRVIRAKTMMHGKTSPVSHTGRGLFQGLPKPLTVTRYHSLIVERKSLPKCFRITSETEDGVIMGIKHKRFPIEGIQFHPESYMTDSGLKILENFCAQLS
ncbi:anthranilate synthase component II [Pseudobacteriovorax antillogorgiicola]|uniref:Para-aminobenzoate synthetase component 2 n=1 Tax=Pseudobacteriovorax antillogorgiicola TaxID=1513793 RepID=A0A1Y6B5P4_9BACT|nr:aminodeoxychorismate/anthranilate synthase component II [Pseudobacteriovorax antillogorgiicola]TCS58883.1 para-aminobenzoate synthetase component 2 [Pseudobacteriovorax antillogorgiicola]SME93646.1 para-aminobenzoate synthetase component 2 [Pseudobacteriovorax antillogorgiicola]